MMITTHQQSHDEHNGSACDVRVVAGGTRQVIHQTGQDPNGEILKKLQSHKMPANQFGSITSLVVMKAREKIANMALAIAGRPMYTKSLAIWRGKDGQLLLSQQDVPPGRHQQHHEEQQPPVQWEPCSQYSR